MKKIVRFFYLVVLLMSILYSMGTIAGSWGMTVGEDVNTGCQYLSNKAFIRAGQIRKGPGDVYGLAEWSDETKSNSGSKANKVEYEKGKGLDSTYDTAGKIDLSGYWKKLRSSFDSGELNLNGYSFGKIGKGNNKIDQYSLSIPGEGKLYISLRELHPIYDAELNLYLLSDDSREPIAKAQNPGGDETMEVYLEKGGLYFITVEYLSGKPVYYKLANTFTPTLEGLTAMEWFHKGKESHDPTMQIDVYEKLIKFDPTGQYIEISEAHNNLGLAYNMKGNIQKSIAEYQRAIELEPNEKRYHCNLGISYFQLHDYEACLACLQRSLSIDNDYEYALETLSNLYLTLGKINHEQQNLKHYLNSYRSLPGCSSAMESLARLKEKKLTKAEEDLVNLYVFISRDRRRVKSILNAPSSIKSIQEAIDNLKTTGDILSFIQIFQGKDPEDENLRALVTCIRDGIRTMSILDSNLKATSPELTDLRDKFLQFLDDPDQFTRRAVTTAFNDHLEKMRITVEHLRSLGGGMCVAIIKLTPRILSPRKPGDGLGHLFINTIFNYVKVRLLKGVAESAREKFEQWAGEYERNWILMHRFVRIAEKRPLLTEAEQELLGQWKDDNSTLEFFENGELQLSFDGGRMAQGIWWREGSNLFYDVKFDDAMDLSLQSYRLLTVSSDKFVYQQTEDQKTVYTAQRL